MIQSPEATRTVLAQRPSPLVEDMRAALDFDPAFEVVGITEFAVDAIRAVRSAQADLVVCDVDLGDPGALELTRFFRLRMPNTTVVLTTSEATDDELFEAARVGAAAYLPLSMNRRLLVSALRRAAAGEFLIDDEVMRRPAVASRVLAHFRLPRGAPEGTDVRKAPSRVGSSLSVVRPSTERLAPLYLPLSGREIEILDLVARGNSNKLIGRRLGISDQTVKNHVTTILKKLEVNDRTEAVVYALRNGWIAMDAPAATRPARQTAAIADL